MCYTTNRTISSQIYEKFCEYDRDCIVSVMVATNSTYELYNKSDVRVADGGFVRLKTISLGYNLPKSFTNNLGIQRAKISLQAQNVLLLYSDKKLNGLDPEFYRSGGVSLPIPRTFTFSLNVGF